MKTTSVFLAVLLVIALLFADAGITRAGPSDLDKAIQSAWGTVSGWTVEIPEWENSTLGSPELLSDLTGRQIAYAFAVLHGAKSVGRIMVGNALYSWNLIEASTEGLSPEPTASDVQHAVFADLGVAVTASQIGRLSFTAYVGTGALFVDVYSIDGRKVGVDWKTKQALPLEQIVSHLVSPEQYGQLATLTEPQYSQFDLSVPIRNMGDVPGLTNHCGPTSGGMIDEFYNVYRSYSSFDGWYTDVQTLYGTGYMETNQHPEDWWPFSFEGTTPEYARSGWLNYASHCGYANFAGSFGYFGETLQSSWYNATASIDHFQPVLVLWIQGAPPIGHYETVVGYRATGGVYHLNDGWGGQTLLTSAFATEWYPVWLWPTGRVVSGSATLQGGARPDAGKEVPMELRVFNSGATWTDWTNNNDIARATIKTVRTGQGAANVVGFAGPTLINRQTGQPLGAGTYDVAVKAGQTLVNIRRNVPIGDSGLGTGSQVDMGTLLEGDCNDSGVVNIQDFSILASTYLKISGMTGYDPRADFDHNEIVNIMDFSLLASNYMKYGFQEVGSGGMAPQGPLTLSTADLTLQPSTHTVQVGQTFNVTIQVAAGDQQVSGVDAFVDFDPACLEVASITNGTALPIQMLSRYDNGLGTLDFSAGTTSTAPSGTFTMCTIQFRAKVQTAGTALTFSQTAGRNTLAAYGGDVVLGNLTGATIVIQP